MRANTSFVSFSILALMAVAAITPVAGAGNMTPEELENGMSMTLMTRQVLKPCGMLSPKLSPWNCTRS